MQAQDPDGDVLSFSLTESPEGMTIDLNTGLISYTPTTQTLNFDTSDSKIAPPFDNQKAFTDDDFGFRFIDSRGSYAIGESFNTFNNLPAGPIFRSSVSFNLASLSGQVISAKLQLQRNKTSGDPIETLGLFDVTTSPNRLYQNPGAYEESPVIFNDLGTGASYGTFDVATGGNPNNSPFA